MEWSLLAGPEWLRPELPLRILLAAVLGGMVGLEREVSGKPAGFRTNLLICVGAAVLTDLSIAVAGGADPQAQAVVADPARIAAQIVSGIGFLGAGTIIQARGSVVGLTTAATLWVVAAIGMAVGAGAYVEAIGVTLLVILALFGLGRLESTLLRRRTEQGVQVTVAPDSAVLAAVRKMLEDAGLDVETVEVEKGQEFYTASFLVTGPDAVQTEVLDAVLDRADVRKLTRLGSGSPF